MGPPQPPSALRTGLALGLTTSVACLLPSHQAAPSLPVCQALLTVGPGTAGAQTSAGAPLLHRAGLLPILGPQLLSRRGTGSCA